MSLRDMDREQMRLFPPSRDELLPLDHPARFVAEFVDALDRKGWAELGVEIEGDPPGAPAYHLRVLLSVWLYGFMIWSEVVPEVGGRVPGSDTLLVVDRVAASRPQHVVAVLPKAPAGHEGNAAGWRGRFQSASAKGVG